MIDLDLKAVGGRIAHYRKLNGLSAQKLADMVGGGLTRGKLAHIETQDRQTLDVGVLLGIAWALKVPPVALLFDLDEPYAMIPATTMEPVPGKLSWKAVNDEVTAWEVIPWFQGWLPWSERESTDAQEETAKKLELLRKVTESQLNLVAELESNDFGPEGAAAIGLAESKLRQSVEEARSAGVNFPDRVLPKHLQDDEQPGDEEV